MIAAANVSIEALERMLLDQEDANLPFKRREPGIDVEANLTVRRAANLDQTWPWQQVSHFLCRWASIFNIEFFSGMLPPPAISFEWTRREVLGHFVLGRNDQGLRFNINLNQQHLDRSEAALLEVLLHEQIHLYQEVTNTSSRPPYHNKAFVEKARSMGLHAELGRGCHIAPPTDPFVALLKQHGVSFEPPERAANVAAGVPVKGRQRLKRWACSCKSVWCGGVLNARCLSCGRQFVLTPTRVR